MKKTANTTEEMRAMSETGGALESLGTTNIPDTAGRDAIHIAVIRRVAETRLFPGQHVGIDGNPSGEKTVGIVDPYLANTVMPGESFWMLLYPRTITGLRHVWNHPDFDAEVQRYEVMPDEIDEDEIYERARTEAFETLKKDPDFIKQVLKNNEPVNPVTWRDRAKLFPEAEREVRKMTDDVGVSFGHLMDFLDGGSEVSYRDDYDNGFSWYGDEYITSLGTDAGGEISDEAWNAIEILLDKKFSSRAKYFSCSC